MDMKTITKDTSLPLAFVGCCIIGLFMIYDSLWVPMLDDIERNQIKLAIMEEKNLDLREQLLNLEDKQDAYHGHIIEIINTLANIEGQLKQMAQQKK